MRLVGAVAVVAACGGTRPAKLPPYEQRITQDLDLLFVIDNSSSTSDEQTVFVQNFPRFVQALDALPAGRPNLHIGVVTSTVDQGYNNGPACLSPDPSDDGRLVYLPRVAPGCSGPTDHYISDVKNGAGGRTTNYSGTLADVFSCIAQVGSIGCGFEAPFEGMKRALDGTRPENAGFLRPTADLGVIILTDEDDCSVADPSLFALDPAQVGPGDFRCQPLYSYDCDPAISGTQAGVYNNCRVKTGSYLHDPAEYADFLSQLAGPNNYFVAVLAGDVSTTITTQLVGTSPQQLALMPSCMATINGDPSIAKSGIRLGDLVDRAGDHGLYQSICQSDYSGSLAKIADLVTRAESPCIGGLIDTTDTDAKTLGLQLACTVTSAGVTLPACEMMDANTPDPGQSGCVYYVHDTSCTNSPTGLALRVVEPPSTTLDLSCAVEVATPQ